MDKKIDKIWNKVAAINKRLLSDWVQSFKCDYHERERKSKRMIKKTLTDKRYQTDPRKNFIWRLMSEEERRVELAMLFLRVMIQDSYWKDFTVTVFGPRHPNISLMILNFEDQHQMLRRQVTGDNWHENAIRLPTTTLHKAARLEKVEQVKECIIRGESMQVNRHGYTPLHSAAMAINPDAEIAKLLIDSVNGSRRCLDKQTDEEWGRNTALHIAAANVNVTENFIQQLKDADPLLRNSRNDTPFHVAAKSSNPDAIIYMLNIFEPTNKGWDVDDVDAGHEFYKTVIKICARNGNAKAVALLIKHGADISQGVLHEVVLESVRRPEEIGKLVQVYQSVVYNAVTWRCLEEESVYLKFKGSDDYAKLYRETVIWLLTNPLEKYEGRDVIQCALAHGASEMFWQIINTKSVFRTHSEEAWMWISDENSDDVENGMDEDIHSDRGNWNWTVFDVTNFTEETFVNNAADVECSKDNDYELPMIHASNQNIGEAVNESTDPNSSPNIRERNFDMPSAPNMPYLTYLLTVFDHWKSSKILSIEPLKELTKPYIALVQRFYFLLGLLQLIFMILFTAYHTPTACSLALMFNASSIICGDNATSSHISQQRSWLALLWLIWPSVLIIGNLFTNVHNLWKDYRAYKRQSRQSKIMTATKRVFKSNELRYSILRKVKHALLRAIPLRIFCIMMFLWLYIYFRSETYESYVDVTAMVLLSGWITNLEFFGGMSKSFSIFELVVKAIILQEIPSFMLFFGFTLVGFSFAMHALRVSTACDVTTQNFVYLYETFFGALSTAFGVSTFYDVTMSHDTCHEESMQYLFAFVYLCYVCTAMIILLNVLIAMMNNRYEKAKRRAENIWRFQMLHMMRVFESHKTLVNVMKKCKILDWWRHGADFKYSVGCYVVCCYGDLNKCSLIFNKRQKRWYLRLLLPVDEQLVKP